MNYIFDIFDNENLIDNFIDDHQLDLNSDLNLLFNEYFSENKCANYNLPNKYSSKLINIDEININDTIYVSYLPCSQKYLDYYENTIGKVFYFNKKLQNGLVYYDTVADDKPIRYVKSIQKEYCSYYGDTPGYCLCIKKLE